MTREEVEETIESIRELEGLGVAVIHAHDGEWEGMRGTRSGFGERHS